MLTRVKRDRGNRQQRNPTILTIYLFLTLSDIQVGSTGPMRQLETAIIGQTDGSRAGLGLLCGMGRAVRDRIARDEFDELEDTRDAEDAEDLDDSDDPRVAGRRCRHFPSDQARLRRNNRSHDSFTSTAMTLSCLRRERGGEL